MGFDRRKLITNIIKAMVLRFCIGTTSELKWFGESKTKTLDTLSYENSIDLLQKINSVN